MQSTPTAAETWAATNVMTTMATRLQGSEQYLGREERQLGSKVGDNAYELFTICPPAEALMLHFEQQQPTFIAVHDIGAAASGGFLTELALALRQPLQQLTIRQQGSGVQLAMLRFIELPSARGVPVRVYGTGAVADTAHRRQIAETLLAFSRLGVLLVQAPSEHLVSAQIGLLRDRLLTVPWPNRDVLLVPRVATPRLDEHARRLVEGTLVSPACASPASTTAGIWSAIHHAWSRLRAGAADPTGRTVAPSTPAPTPVVAAAAGAAAGAPVNLRPFGSAPAAAMPAPAARGYDTYVQGCAALRGAQACLVFDRTTRRTMALSAQGVDPSGWTHQLAAMLDATRVLQEGLGGGDPALEVICTLERHLVVLRTLPRRPELGVALVLDRAQANAAAMRSQLQRLDAMLDQ